MENLAGMERLGRIYRKRFSRPDVQLAQQINVDTKSPGELIVPRARPLPRRSRARAADLSERRVQLS